MKEKAETSKKDVKFYTAIKIFIFFVILLFLIMIATKVTQRKDSVKKYADFIELADQIDVLFFGSSHVINSINPVQLYSEYGITAYNMGKSGGIMPESYWTFMNALDYCSPECIVVDVWALDRDYHYIDTKNGTQDIVNGDNAVNFLHENLDFMPLSKNKIAAINDLIETEEYRKEFYWDFSLYHDRWSSLNADDFKIVMGEVEGETNLGSTAGYIVVPGLSIEQSPRINDILSEETSCVQYLNKIIDECEKRDIKVVLAFFPMSQSYNQDWMAANTARKIAEEKGISFIDMLPQDTQTIINYRTDMFDGIHANVNGMRKITSYVGRHLREVEALEDHRKDISYVEWDEKVSKWQTTEINRLLGENDLYVKLGTILNLNANSIIFMRGNSAALQDKLVQEFIMQLSGSTNILEAANIGGPYLLIRDATSGTMQIQEYVGEQQIESFQTILGDTYYIAIKPFSAIYVDGNMDYNYLNMEEYYESAVQITVLGQEGEIMNQFFYDSSWKLAGSN